MGEKEMLRVPQGSRGFSAAGRADTAEEVSGHPS